MFSQDFVINRGGQLSGGGAVGGALAGAISPTDNLRIEPGLLRPYFNEKGVPCVTINTGRKKRVEIRDKRTNRLIRVEARPIFEEVRIKDLTDGGIQLPPTTNATTLRKEEWLMYDGATIAPQRERLRFYRDIARMSTVSFDGLGVKIKEHETVSDPGKAYMDMDGLSEGTDDTPKFQLEGTPIPVFHSNFTLDLRTLSSSRRSGMPLSTRNTEWATRRVMELVETNAIGVAGSSVLTYGGASTQQGGYGRTSAVYGAINFPSRITKTDLTTPTGSNPNDTVDDVLEMRQLLYDAKHYGPYGIYHSTDWDEYLDHDYMFTDGSNWAVNPNMTLRQRLLAIGTEGGDADAEKQIKFVKRLDYLTPSNSHAFTMIMVSMNPNVISALNGMPVTIFQYETKGGWEMHFKVACIMLVEMYADFAGNCGILHARTA